MIKIFADILNYDRNRALIFTKLSILVLLALFNSQCERYIKIRQGKTDNNFRISNYMIVKLGIRSYNELMIPLALDITRTDKPSGPGYYYQEPSHIGYPMVSDSSDINFIKNLILPYLSSGYYDDEIFKYTQSYYLTRLNRKEFYFTIESNGVPIRFSGWYGKFVHIIVSTEFNTKADFIEESLKFFNLPLIEEKDIYFDFSTSQPFGSGYERFYALENSNEDFKLIGYTILKAGAKKREIEKTVLDLTVYASGESLVGQKPRASDY